MPPGGFNELISLISDVTSWTPMMLLIVKCIEQERTMTHTWTPQNSALVEAALPHPVPVCESVNLAAIALPPLTTYPHTQVLRVAAAGALSKLQLETAAYAVQAIGHGGRAFFLGDATGIGKTRTAMAVLLHQAECAAEEKKRFRAVWISCRADLEADVRGTLRLLETVESQQPRTEWRPLAHYISGKACAKSRGAEAAVVCPERQVAFATYGRLRRGCTATKTGATLQATLAWLGEAEEAMCIFDEAHIAKCPRSATHHSVLHLQRRVPHARVLYCTATAASDVASLSYMDRIGLFGEYGDAPFASHTECQRALRRGGVATLELVAMYLKSRGLYVSRAITPIAEMHGPRLVTKLTGDQIRLYDTCCSRWLTCEQTHATKSTLMQSFFLRMVTSFKAIAIVEEVRQAVAQGWSVVISVQSTGTGKDSSCRKLMQHCGVATHGLELPNDPLDVLTLALHGAPGVGRVAEITGRGHRMVRDWGTGEVVQQSRTSSTVKQDVTDFQADKVHVALLSAAGGVGLSLHAHQPNSRRRLHLLLELPWSSEALVQQCGRTHRTGETRPPLYRMVTTDLPLDARVAQAVIKRMARLGALSRGDRNHSTGGASEINTPLVSTTAFHTAGVEVLFREATEMLADVARETVTRDKARALLQVGQGFRCDAIRRRVGDCLASGLDDLDSAVSSVAAQQNTVALYEKACLVLSRRKRHMAMILAAVHQLFPGVRDGAAQRWTPQSHGLFSLADRYRAETMLLCARRPESILSRLPQDILEQIMSVSMSDEWALSPRVVVAALKASNLPRDTLVRGNADTFFLPRMATLPVQVQRILWTTIDRAQLASTIPAEDGQITAGERRRSHATSLIQHCYPYGIPAGCNAHCIYQEIVKPGHMKVVLELRPVPDATVDTDRAFQHALRVRHHGVGTAESLDPPPPELPVSECNQQDQPPGVGQRTTGHTGEHPEAPQAPIIFQTKAKRLARVVAPRILTVESAAVSWDLEVWAPGSVRPVARLTTQQWPAYHCQHLRPWPTTSTNGIEQQWIAESGIQNTRRINRCRYSRAAVELVLASHALHEWDNTTGILVRGGPPLLSEPLIGVALWTCTDTG